MPFMRCRVIEVVALSRHALSTGPVLGDDATVCQHLDRIGAHTLVSRVEYVPVANPKVELSILGMLMQTILALTALSTKAANLGSGRRLANAGSLAARRLFGRFAFSDFSSHSIALSLIELGICFGKFEHRLRVVANRDRFLKSCHSIFIPAHRIQR